jgi:tripartite-type tricarboxylate transporter receptor subunit TctC
MALLAGQVSVMFAQMPIVRPHILSGKLRALAVASEVRSQAMPDLPTVAEAGFPGFKVDVWFGVVAPAGTPSGIVSRLSSEIGKIMRMPDVRERLVPEGAEPAAGSPEAFAALIRRDIANSAELVRKAGARVD